MIPYRHALTNNFCSIYPQRVVHQLYTTPYETNIISLNPHIPSLCEHKKIIIIKIKNKK
jgi:hypothetical protein